MAKNDYAIIVGINKYDHLSDLKGPVNDAMCFRDWLLAPDGGNVPPEHIKMVLSKSETPHACPGDDLPDQAGLSSVNYSMIEKEFDKLISIADDSGGRAGRRLYVFLAGHGFGATINETVVLMSNGDYKRRTGFHIPGRSYIDWFRTAALFKEVVLFMDCCRDIPSSVTLKSPPWPPNPDPGGADVKFCFGFGTKWSSKTRERKMPEGGHVHGFFTEALLDALKHSPPNEKGEVLASTIAGYVHHRLKKLEEQGIFKPDEFEKRKPEFIYPSDSDFVFLRREAAVLTPVRITFSEQNESFSVKLMSDKVVGDDFEVISKIEKMSGVWELKLQAGFYFMQVIDRVTQNITKQKVFSVTSKEVTDVRF